MVKLKKKPKMLSMRINETFPEQKCFKFCFLHNSERDDDRRALDG